jgi:UV DNA damage endonuclease
MIEYGYCCINETLKEEGIYSSRTMQLSSFNMEEANSRAVKNCLDLVKIMEWNVKNNIKVFRIGSDLFPRMTCQRVGYTFESLPSHIFIKTLLYNVGQIAWKNNIHLSMHPGPYTTLASPQPDFITNAIKEINMHVLVAKMLDPTMTKHIPINIHIGGVYNNKIETASRFIKTFNNFDQYTKSLIVLENDDKKNGWSIKDLYTLIYVHTNIPITFDFHHWLFRHDDNTIKEDFELAYSTWNKKSMQVHYSQSPTPEKLVPAHSDYYRDPLPTWINDFTNIHVHLECKKKEKALFHYIDTFIRKVA